MQVEVNEQFKFASVWLTNEEKDNADIIDSLQPLMEKYKKMKYRFVVFQSGGQNLLDLTKDLLAHNKNLDKNSTDDTAEIKKEKKPSIKKKLETLGSQVQSSKEETKVKKSKSVEIAL
ncbi:MAG: hypothetical protein HFI84_02750 [Eubacterium sp.]|nr:hypothetical protein [Eubacterium sp.]